jgi:formate/nitrite transporter FocA (FNT family)
MDARRRHILFIIMGLCYAVSLILVVVAYNLGLDSNSFTFSLFQYGAISINLVGWALLLYILYYQYKEKLPPIGSD